MAGAGSSTFLFTDIEESTRLLQRLGETYEQVFVRHLELVTEAVHAAGGRIDHSTGDGVLAVFDAAGQAVRAAVQAQRALVGDAWPPDAAVRVRMGLHTGPVRAVGGELVGLAVHVAARVMAAAHGRQILVSGTTAALVPGLAARDLGVHRLRGVIDEHRLLQVTGPGLPDAFPPPRTAGALAHNLPTLRTSFVGRAEVVAELLDRLGADRLTTLIGPPGVGKTRLALEAAEAAAPAFPDGVWFADLTGTDGPGVLGAVAAAVGAPAEPGGGAKTLTDHLSAQRCVVLVDNCEHVAADVADLVATILAAAPGVHVLATSRTLLGLPGERRLDVVPLELPDGDDAGALASSPAGALLLDRALTADPSLVVDDTAALAALCREVDGIPLALELAAARLSDVEPSAVLADLRRAGVPPGHDHRATLAATVSWSVDRLRPATRAVLARLGVFAGPFPVDAAVAVAGIGSVDPADVPEAIDTLVRRSLVAVEGGALGRRYRLLRIIAEHAVTLLDEQGETAEVRRRHAEYWADAAQRWNNEMGGPGEREAMDRLAAARADLFSAFDWAIAEGDRLALQLGRRLWYAWASRGPVDDGLRRMTAAAQLEDDDADLVAANHRGRSVLQYLVGDIQGAYDSLGRAIAARPASSELLAARQQRAALASQLGRPGVARAQLAEVVAELRAGNADGGLVYALASLASAEVRTGLAEAGLAHFDEARGLAAAAGDQRTMVGCAAGAADARTLLGDAEGAVRAYRDLLPQARELGDEYVLTLILRNLGGQLVVLSDPDAGDVLREARDRCLRAGRESAAADCTLVLAQHELRHGEPSAAFALTTEGLTAPSGTVDRTTLATGVATRGRALLRARQPELATAMLCSAAAWLVREGEPVDENLADAVAEAKASVSEAAFVAAEHDAANATLEDVVDAALAVTWPSE
jgi:predicted ATPase/class 3 adenylate cyclase